MTQTDQSTQVNFPTTPRQRRLYRFNTSSDLLSRMGSHSNHGGPPQPSSNFNRTPSTLSRVESPLSGFSEPTNYRLSSINFNNKSLPRPKSLNFSVGHPQTQTAGTSTPESMSSISIESGGSTTPHKTNGSVIMPLSTPPPMYTTEGGQRKKWNAPLAAYSVGKLWKSQSVSALKSTPSFDAISVDTNKFTSGCECSCMCNMNRIEEKRRNEKGEGSHHSKWQSSTDPEYLNTPEVMSWRKLHMSRAKLKATATTSELLSGFAMIAMIELQINDPTDVPEWLFIMFSVCTTVLVAVHIFALMISTYLLPNIDAVSKLEVTGLINESPHERMRGFIELAWTFSTIFGLFLFLVEVAILCWVKFWDYSKMAATAGTIIVIPVLILFVAFAIHFYHSLFIQKCDKSMNEMEKLEDMKRYLDRASCPV